MNLLYFLVLILSLFAPQKAPALKLGLRVNNGVLLKLKGLIGSDFTFSWCLHKLY